MQKYLYHYTDVQSLAAILYIDGFIKTNDCNLLKPANGSEKTRVVWLTSEKTPQGIPLSIHKIEVRIAIPNNVTFLPLETFAAIRNMEPEWKKKFESLGNYKTWYVSPQNIPVTLEAVEEEKILLDFVSPEAASRFCDLADEILEDTENL